MKKTCNCGKLFRAVKQGKVKKALRFSNLLHLSSYECEEIFWATIENKAKKDAVI